MILIKIQDEVEEFRTNVITKNSPEATKDKLRVKLR